VRSSDTAQKRFVPRRDNSSFRGYKLLKSSPQIKFKVFLERDAFSARKTSLFISFTSLIGMG
jgi:hypothetical protein